jgi:hypothetical protein
LWSLQLALRLEHWTDVVLRPEFHHDNNHWTTTLWLHAVGAGAAPLIQRALALVSAALTLLLLGWSGWRRSPAAGAIAVALAAGSYLLVQYGSEARGYSGAALAALLAYALVLEGGERPGWRVPALWLVVLLGVASHLTFLFAYLALLAWHPVRLTRRVGVARALGRLVLVHAVPVATIGVLYFTALRHVVIGGGPKYTEVAVARDALGLVFGFPMGSLLGWVGVALAAVIVGLELTLRLRERDDTALFFLACLLLVPAGTLAVREAEVLYVRYFFVCVPFLLLLCASLLARLWAGGVRARSVAGSALLALLAGNATPIAALVRLGRGQYAEAMRYLDAESPAGPIEIALTGWDGEALLRHQSARIAPERELVFLRPETSPARPPRWILVERLDPEAVPEPELAGAYGRTYRLARAFPYAGLSGQCWFLYRRGRAE